MDYVIRTPRQLAPALRAERKRAGKTQKTTAAAVGLQPKTVSALETDPGRCAVESLFRLAAALGLELVLRPKADERSARRPGDSETTNADLVAEEW